MPTVIVTGGAYDHGLDPIPSQMMPELWFRPNGPGVSETRMLAGVDRKATLNPNTGAFSVRLFSDPEGRIWYRPFMRWLLNPAESLPERWAWGYVEWPVRVWPDAGGPIGGLIETDAHVPAGHVYVGEDAGDPAIKARLQLNPVTGVLYERRVS